MLFQEMWLGFVFCLHYEKGELNQRKLQNMDMGKFIFDLDI